MIKNLEEWVASIRDASLVPGSPVKQKNGKWEIAERKETWKALGPRVFDEYLDRFKMVAVEVLRERHPQFELKPEERFAAGIRGKVLKHSVSLRKGLAETLALLGTSPEALTSCSHGKAETTAFLAVREILKDSDWVLWASLSEHLPTLAEAAPNELLDAVETALSDLPNSLFKEVFAQERSGIAGWNYMTGLLWALETLAWHPDYLMRVTILLGDLAAIDPGGNWANRPAKSITDIFLPWHPQTYAAIPKRKVAVEALLHEQPAVGWKVLLALLPQMHGVTSGCRKPVWRAFIPPDWSEKVTVAEYWEQVGIYADLAVSAAAKDLGGLVELIRHLPNLPNPAHSRAVEHLGSHAVVGLTESARLPVWQALMDLTTLHRKFADAKWAMAPEVVARLEAAAGKLAPKSVSLLHRRLFCDGDFDLIEEKDDFEAQQQKLDLKRRAAVREILDASNIEGVLDFARQVESPWKVGWALGYEASDFADAALLPDYLGTVEKPLVPLIRGFVLGRFFVKSWPWVDNTVTAAWTIQQKATFLALLPFVRDTWQRVAHILSNHENEYWRKANVDPFREREHLLEAVEKLLQYQRPGAAACCLRQLVHDKVNFLPELAARVLMDLLTTQEAQAALDSHAIREIIEWLQSNPAADQRTLLQIEWNYLPLLDELYGGAPKTLERRIASEPSFYCEVIRAVFRSDKDEHKNRQLTDQEKNIAENVYRLLHGWKTVPGTSAEGSFDGVVFTRWLADVKRLAAESGHLRIAMSQVGQVLPYAPSDVNGLWIHTSVAEALNAKDGVEMRSGFTCKLFNLRGVHSPSGGREELGLARRHRKEAEALEQQGYHRFAAAMREFAESYERDAKREAARHPLADGTAP